MPRSSIKRFRIGLNVAVQIILLVALVGIVNMLSCRRFTQWDHTPSKRYSLSQTTRQILDHLSHDLYLTVAFSRSSDVYHYTQRMIELYEQAGAGKLHVRWVDPLRDPAAVAELRNQDVNLGFDQNKILISKTEKLEVAGEQGPTVAPYQVVTEEDMFERAENQMFRDGKYKRGRVTQYRLERALTSALVSATQERAETVYIIVSHGSMRRVEGKNAGSTLLLEGGRRQNLRVEPLHFTPNTSVPEDASTVMIISPQQDFSGAELTEIFKQYWEKRRGGLVLLLDPLYYDQLPNLRGYLENEYGVRWEDNRVLSLKTRGGRNLKVYEPPAWFLEGSAITASLGNRYTILPQQSSTLNIRVQGDHGDSVTAQATDKKPLMAASYAIDGFWKEDDYRAPNPTADAPETVDIHIAVSVELGAGINQDLRLNSSRMVVVGNGNLIDPDFYVRSPDSLEFVLNSLNWAGDREEMVAGIDVMEDTPQSVAIGDRPYEKMEWMSLRILPGTVFFAGLLVAFFRRR